MSGVQLFLSEAVPIVHGHLALVDAPWALTAIAQKQFWPHTDLSGFGDGRVRDVLSVVVSDWDAPGTLRPQAGPEVQPGGGSAPRVWAQLKAHVNGRAGGPAARRHAGGLVPGR